MLRIVRQAVSMCLVGLAFGALCALWVAGVILGGAWFLVAGALFYPWGDL